VTGAIGLKALARSMRDAMNSWAIGYTVEDSPSLADGGVAIGRTVVRGGAAASVSQSITESRSTLTELANEPIGGCASGGERVESLSAACD
jgi:hypothetical protein